MRQLGNMTFPGRECLFPNPWLGDVIHDEDLIRMPIDKLNGLRQVLFEDQNVVFQAELS